MSATDAWGSNHSIAMTELDALKEQLRRLSASPPPLVFVKFDDPPLAEPALVYANLRRGKRGRMLGAVYVQDDGQYLAIPEAARSLHPSREDAAARLAAVDAAMQGELPPTVIAVLRDVRRALAELVAFIMIAGVAIDIAAGTAWLAETQARIANIDALLPPEEAGQWTWDEALHRARQTGITVDEAAQALAVMAGPVSPLADMRVAAAEIEAALADLLPPEVWQTSIFANIDAFLPPEGKAHG